MGFRILLVEDEQMHAELVKHAFVKESPDDQIFHVQSAQEVLGRLAEEVFDILLLDYSLPDHDGIELMKLLQQRRIHLPVIIITGHGDEQIAVEVMKLGAIDYVIKSGNFFQALPTLTHKAIHSYQLKRKYEEAEVHLHFQALLLDNVHDAIIGADMDEEIIYWNHGAEKTFGYRADEILGRNIRELFPISINPNWSRQYSDFTAQEEKYNEWCGLTASNRQIWLAVRSRIISTASQDQIGILNVARDITEQKKLQEETERQVKKTTTINQFLTVITETAKLDLLQPNLAELLVDVFEVDKAWLDSQDEYSHSHSLPFRLQNELSKPLLTELYNYLGDKGNNPLVIDDALFDREEWHDFLNRHKVHSQLLFLLRPKAGKPWLLGLWQTKYTRLWTEAEKDLLIEIAHIITLALEKAVLYLQAQEATKHEQLLNGITQTISQSLDINEILQTICEELGNNLQVDRAFFLSFRNSSVAIVTHEYCRSNWQKLVGQAYKREFYEEGVDALRQGLPIVVDNLKDLTDTAVARNMEEISIKSALLVPVISRGELTGTIGLNQCSYERNWRGVEIRLLQSLSRSCSIAVHNARLYTQSKKSEDRYRNLFDTANDAIIIVDIVTGLILDVNSKAENLLGYDRTKLLKLYIIDIHPPDEKNKYQKFYNQVRNQGRMEMRDASVWTNAATALPVEVSTSVIGSGESTVIQTLLRDMAEQRKLERQLFHAQRLESIGTLTGGIAHDFNNLLAGILGYAELFKKKLDPANTKLYNYANIIEQSATHGAELAQRLVAFARGGSLKSQIIDLNTIVEDTLKLLRRALGRSVEIWSELEASLYQIDANATQIQQVLMNLCINARDAMAQGGKLSVSTRNLKLTDDQSDLKPGSYVELSVSDTGTGMDEETLNRIFEPFFTTKEIGKGTGLGLAMVSAIVRESKGHISIKTELNVGTTFRILLPAVENSSVIQKEEGARIAGGNETILVVDDEETLRYLAKDLLEAYGYHVLMAADGTEALELYDRLQKEIGLVLLDMVMPRMSGRELCHKILEINPKAKIVFASGYCPPEDVDQIWREGIKGFVQKPYQIEDLAAELRTVLDGKK